MTQPAKPDKETLLAELDLHKAEFISLRDEMSRLNQSEEQYLNFNLVALAAILAIATSIIAQHAVSIFLVFALIFHIFLWEMLSATRSAEKISVYLVEYLIPRVNAILDQLGDDRANLTAFGWEVELRLSASRASTLLTGSLIPNRKWIPILSSAGLIIAYLLLAPSSGVEIGLRDVGLIMLNLIQMILSAISSLMIALGANRKTRTLRLSAKP